MDNVAVIISTKDPAGLNIKDSLFKNFEFKKTGRLFEDSEIFELDSIKIYTTNKDSIFCENIDKKIDADFFVFATKHKSESNIPTLTTHVAGNFGKAELGGNDKTLCVSMPFFMKSALKFLNENKLEGFDVVQEATHHGPYIEKPLAFIEIGSSIEQWRNKEAADLIAGAIVNAVKNSEDCEAAIGLGGLHYALNLRKIMLGNEFAIGHICPKYNLHNLNEDLLMQMINKNTKKSSKIFLDWKGMGEEKQRIVELLNSLDLEFEKVK